MAQPTIAMTELSIRNFRGIDTLDLDFRRPDGLPNTLVVLAGPNGSGKTAVLEAALIAAGGSGLVTGRFDKRAVRFGSTDFAINAVIRGQMFDWAISSSVGNFPAVNRFIPFWYFSSWRAPELVGPVEVSVGRRGPKPRKNDTNRLKNIKRALVDAAAFGDFQSRKQFVSPYPRWRRKLNTAWANFYPEDGGFLVDFVQGATESEILGLDIYLTRSDNVLLEVEMLSAGQLELFMFLAALVLNDEREGIVFIDEPELHLDPQWHRLIIRTLVELQPRAQFIVATHSPEIFDAARSYERHFLVPEDDPRSWLWSNLSRSDTVEAD